MHLWEKRLRQRAVAVAVAVVVAAAVWAVRGLARVVRPCRAHWHAHVDAPWWQGRRRRRADVCHAVVESAAPPDAALTAPRAGL